MIGKVALYLHDSFLEASNKGFKLFNFSRVTDPKQQMSYFSASLWQASASTIEGGIFNTET